MTRNAALNLARVNDVRAIPYDPPTMLQDVSYETRPAAGHLVVLDRTRDRFQRSEEASAALPATPWFRAMWNAALGAKAERAWHLLPEDVFDRIDEEGADFATSDAEFLGYAAVSPDVPSPAAVAAIRLLGILAEESKLERGRVAAVLEDALSNDDPQRRYYAAKAIWQARAREGISAIHRRLLKETVDSVVDVLKRAIAVLE